MNNTAKMIIVLTAIGIISGGLLTYVNTWAEPEIIRHRQEETQNALKEIIPGASEFRKISNAEFAYFEALHKDGSPAGYLFVNSGNGYQGNISVLVGLDSARKTVLGIKVLEQSETPGLGTKASEPAYTDQFRGFPANESIAWKKVRTKANEIEAVTGATISSKAIGGIVENGIMLFNRNFSEHINE